MKTKRMKIEIKESSMVLVPENVFEKESLRRLKKKGVESIRFENEWDQEGGLILNHPVENWGT